MGGDAGWIGSGGEGPEILFSFLFSFLSFLHFCSEKSRPEFRA